MKTFIAIISLSLALNLVSGYQYSEAEDREATNRDDGDDDEPAMDISETKKCYVFGQCQEYSIDFKDTKDAEGCHKFCGNNNECNWWSWEPELDLCMLFVNCTEANIDPPLFDPCPTCISGQKLCPSRECHGGFKCQGHFVDSYDIATLEECIEKCNNNVNCQWFTLEKDNDHCILYEECENQFDCDTCASGEKKCANGYKGTTAATPTCISSPGDCHTDADCCGSQVCNLRSLLILNKCAIKNGDPCDASVEPPVLCEDGLQRGYCGTDGTCKS